MVASAYVQPLLASNGSSLTVPPTTALTVMFARVVVPSFVGGGGTENVQVFAIPTSVRSTAANSAVLVTG